MFAIRRCAQWLLVPAFVLSLATQSLGQTLRIVSWNTANDVGNMGTDTHPPAIGGPAQNVLQAIGALNVSGSTRPIDVLALQESVYFTGTGANPTAQSYATILNNLYPGGNYQVASLVNGTSTGAQPGNGPQTLVYRSSTLTVLSQQALGMPAGDDIPRQVMLYRFQPVGYNLTASFYMFNSHFKAGTGSDDNNRRGIEGSLIASTANGFAANSPIIFAGDFNPTNNTNDQGYATVIAGTGVNNNRAIDPLNPSNVFQNWSLNNSAAKAMQTYAPSTTEFFPGQGTGGMNYRDDMLLNSPGMVSGNGINYINNSFVAFGNTGNHTFQQAITSGALSASAFAAQLTDYNSTQAMGVLTSLAQSSDHLPVVADYRITAVPEPTFVLLVMAGAAGGVSYFRRWWPAK